MHVFKELFNSFIINLNLVKVSFESSLVNILWLISNIPHRCTISQLPITPLFVTNQKLVVSTGSGSAELQLDSSSGCSIRLI